MSITVEIKNLPRTDEILDSDLLIVEKQNYTAAAPGALVKDYLIDQINDVITANTYTADGTTIELVNNEFKVKSQGIGINQLDAEVISKLGNGSAQSLTGDLKQYNEAITADRNFLEIVVNAGGSSKRYAIRLYEIP